MNTAALYRRMLSYLRPYAFLFVFSLALSWVIVGLEGLSLWLSAPLVKTLFLPDATPPILPDLKIANAYGLLKYYTYTTLQRYDPTTALKFVCLFMALAFLAKNFVTYAKHLIVGRLNLCIDRDLRNDVYRHALTLPITYYDRNSTANITAFVVRDVNSVNQSLTTTLDKLILDPFRVMFFLVMLMMISIKLTLVIIVVLPILSFVIWTIGTTVRRRSRKMLKVFSGLVAILGEVVSGIRIVKMFSMERSEQKKFEAESQQFVTRSFRAYVVSSLSGPITETLGVIVAALLLWYGGREVLSGRGISPEDFMLFLIYVFSCFKPLKSLTSINSVLQTGFASADRVFGLLDTPPEKLPEPATASAPELREGIEFRDVHFTYPATTDEVLHGVSFTIKRGQVIALVGPSGSGKSTILDLLPRFYEIQSGAIFIDGVDVRQLDLPVLRRHFGTVAQETVLFNDTVLGNISYGVPGATQEQVVACAKAANAWEFIEKLPQGLQTIVGERGTLLSGGQRQRLAIARALLRNPPVLILDEATSSLDTESERLVQQAVNTLMQSRTVLVVAHRLSTIRHADQILFLENGSIVERGTHEQLYAGSGRYRRLHDMQFAGS